MRITVILWSVGIISERYTNHDKLVTTYLSCWSDKLVEI